MLNKFGERPRIGGRNFRWSYPTDKNLSDIEESVNHIILGLAYSSRSRKDIEIVNSVVVSVLMMISERARRVAQTHLCLFS